MSTDEAYIKVAERNRKPDSELLHRILEAAMTAEEARFLLELPTSADYIQSISYKMCSYWVYFIPC